MNKASTTVSVVIPAYNAEKTLPKTLNSVLEQTLPPLEIIVIDDCSADNTAAIVAEYAARDSRLLYRKNEKNAGVSHSRNVGVAMASGEWIAFLDSDDCWTPEKLEHQLAAAQKDPTCAFLFTASAFMDQDGCPMTGVFSVAERVTRRELLKQNIISCSSVLIKRDLMIRHPMRDGTKMHEDFAAWLDVLSDTPFAMGVNEPLLVYRIQSTSKSGNRWKSLLMAWRTYRAVQISPIATIYYMCFNVTRSMKKYKNIKKKV